MTTAKDWSHRDKSNRQAIEDYLKTIYKLAEKESPVSTSRISESRQVKPASATNMIQRLARLNLVNYEKHRGVTLTEAGEKIALEMIRHHRLIELYLIEALDFTWDEVHEQAEILEHVLSEKLEARIAEALGNPTFDPHGEPIPSLDGVMTAVDVQPLIGLGEGDQAVVSRVMNDSDSELLNYLAELGIIPGARIFLVKKAPYDGPLTVEVNGTPQVVGYKAAATVFVES